MCSVHLLPGTWNLFHAVQRTSSAHITGDELVPGLTQIQSSAVLPGWSLVQEHQSIGACFDVRHSIFLKNKLHLPLPVLFKASAIQFSRCWERLHNRKPFHSLETWPELGWFWNGRSPEKQKLGHKKQSTWQILYHIFTPEEENAHALKGGTRGTNHSPLRNTWCFKC